ncbi:hypothetical protein NF27_BR00010 [Candidatus Jidaibacter acanthamoeba]|uniref:Uncharacterized protein n=2 Tax=Candidatus Jidaibacter acanthamoebae TaxID=86105 RepID=A0A0C1QQ99_9RICK|nr:hypothetical protein NF27_BR00010 [Candidatus Jidaibacter acanthamoeba]
MFSDKQEYKVVDPFKEEFRRQGWEMAFAEYVYTQFKLHHYIRKSEKYFEEKARKGIPNLINYNQNINFNLHNEHLKSM